MTLKGINSHSEGKLKEGHSIGFFLFLNYFECYVFRFSDFWLLGNDDQTRLSKKKGGYEWL